MKLKEIKECTSVSFLQLALTQNRRTAAKYTKPCVDHWDTVIHSYHSRAGIDAHVLIKHGSRKSPTGPVNLSI